MAKDNTLTVEVIDFNSGEPLALDETESGIVVDVSDVSLIEIVDTNEKTDSERNFDGESDT